MFVVKQLLILRNDLGDSGLGEAEKWGRKRQKSLSHPLPCMFGVAAGGFWPHSSERSEVFHMKIHQGEAFTACSVPEFLILFTLVLIPTQVGVTEVRGQTQTFCLELFNLPSFIFCAKPLLKLHEGTISAF